MPPRAIGRMMRTRSSRTVPTSGSVRCAASLAAVPSLGTGGGVALTGSDAPCAGSSFGESSAILALETNALREGRHSLFGKSQTLLNSNALLRGTFLLAELDRRPGRGPSCDLVRVSGHDADGGCVKTTRLQFYSNAVLC